MHIYSEDVTDGKVGSLSGGRLVLGCWWKEGGRVEGGCLLHI